MRVAEKEINGLSFLGCLRAWVMVAGRSRGRKVEEGCFALAPNLKGDMGIPVPHRGSTRMECGSLGLFSQAFPSCMGAGFGWLRFNL